MNIELQNGHIANLAHLPHEDHFKYLLFSAFESGKLKEIGWERTVSAEQIHSMLYKYMVDNNLSLITRNGALVFAIIKN